MNVHRISRHYASYIAFMPIFIGFITALLIGCVGSDKPRNPMRQDNRSAAASTEDVEVYVDGSSVAPCSTCTIQPHMKVWHSPDVACLPRSEENIAPVRTVSWSDIPYNDVGLMVCAEHNHDADLPCNTDCPAFNPQRPNCFPIPDGPNPTPPNGPSTLFPTLREGTLDEVPDSERERRILFIKTAQTILRLRGYDVGPSDGAFGPRTYRAVLAFQGDHGIFQTGIVDGTTWNLLLGDYDRYDERLNPPFVPDESQEDDSPQPDGRDNPPSFPEPPSNDPFADNPELVGDAAATVARMLIGLTEKDAETVISFYNIVLENKARSQVRFRLRVTKRDGQTYPGTCDYRLDRINVVIEGGRVVSADVG